MPRQILWVLLGFLVQIPVVILLFTHLPVRVAAILAGFLFCTLGVWIFVLGLKDFRWRRGFAFWINLPFLFLFALPLWLMSIARVGRGLVHWDIGGYPFFFVPVQVLHEYANYFFRALVIFLVVDALRFYGSQRKKRAKAPSISSSTF